jgi:transcription-repair coupling factor (superfamily II helicase)
MEFSEMGSGYKIAMRDLEIRGAGDILGAEQSGHMEKVGYDMYIKLLNEAVSELKGEVVEQARQVKLDIGINAYIPQDYIVGDENRILYYTKISKINNKEDLDKLSKEISDNFGSLPAAAEQLLQVAYIKSLCQKVMVKTVSIQSFGAKIVFYSEVSEQKWYSCLQDGDYMFRQNASNHPEIFVQYRDSLQKTQQEVIKFLVNLTQKV